MNLKFRQCLLVAASAIMLTAICGCGRRNEGIANQPDMSWSDLLKTNEPIIIHGSWEDAENAYAKLSKGAYTDSELKQWIELQVEILDKTASDPLKDELNSKRFSRFMTAQTQRARILVG